MSISFGFYNAINHDRQYDAVQMSSIFDGIIRDGVYATIGDAMIVRTSQEMIVTVGSGRAWFDHTWTLNDTLYPLTLDLPELVLDRIDAIVLEVDASEDVRANSIKIVKGTASSNPERPDMVKTDDVHQYPLAFIYLPAGTTEIDQANITNMVGTSACPFVTGPLEHVTTDQLILQWQKQWENWLNIVKTNQATFDEELQNWQNEEKTQFLQWFYGLQYILDGDVAGHLQNQIDDLKKKPALYFNS